MNLPSRPLPARTRIHLLTGALTLALVAGSGAAAAQGTAAPAAAEDRVVYHVNDPASMRDALNFITNHVAASPQTRVALLANGRGVLALGQGERDRQGDYASTMATLQGKGVRFIACRNSMTKNNLQDSALVANVQVVQAGVVELTRLQAAEHYAYIKP